MLSKALGISEASRNLKDTKRAQQRPLTYATSDPYKIPWRAIQAPERMPRPPSPHRHSN